jgi:hypothetical protein
MKMSDVEELDDVCLSCRLGHHDECDDFWLNFEDKSFEWLTCCCGGDFDRYDFMFKQKQVQGLLSVGGSYLSGNSEDEVFETYIDDFQGTKAPEEYKDPVSSGRKIAAKVAPIPAGMVCEWAWLENAGGGVQPIIGCPGRPASDRHHGPDKNTLNNVLVTNLHRICDWCHNQWHAKNDPFYGERPDASKPFIPDGECQPHDPFTRATDEIVYQEDAKRREEARKHGANI